MFVGFSIKTVSVEKNVTKLKYWVRGRPVRNMKCADGTSALPVSPSFPQVAGIPSAEIKISLLT